MRVNKLHQLIAKTKEVSHNRRNHEVAAQVIINELLCFLENES